MARGFGLGFGLQRGQASDLAAPIVASFSPVDGYTDVKIDDDFVITLDEFVFPGAAASFRLYATIGDTLIEEFDETDFGGAVVISGKTVTIDWTADLTGGGVAYYVLADAGSLVDPSGNAWAGITAATTWNIVTDSTAPVLSAQDVDEITETTAHVHVSTNEGNGSYRFVVVATGATAPSGTQVIAGTDGDDLAPVHDSGLIAVSAVGEQTHDVTTDIVAGTMYDCHWAHRDAAGNISTAVAFTGWETTGIAGPGPVTIDWDDETTDNIPEFAFTGLAAAGLVATDTLKLYKAIFGSGDPLVLDYTYTITAGDAAADGGTATNPNTGPTNRIADGVWQYHARGDNGLLGDLSNEQDITVDTVDAPIIVILSGTGDNQPDIGSSGDLLIGDTETYYVYTDAELTILEDSGTAVVDADGSMNVTDALGPLTDGAKWIIATTTRGAAVSSQSNTETITIAAADDILMETGDHLLLETGDLMLME